MWCTHYIYDIWRPQSMRYVSHHPSDRHMIVSQNLSETSAERWIAGACREHLVAVPCISCTTYLLPRYKYTTQWAKSQAHCACAKPSPSKHNERKYALRKYNCCYSCRRMQRHFSQGAKPVHTHALLAPQGAANSCTRTYL